MTRRDSFFLICGSSVLSCHRHSPPAFAFNNRNIYDDILHVHGGWNACGSCVFHCVCTACTCNISTITFTFFKPFPLVLKKPFSKADTMFLCHCSCQYLHWLPTTYKLKSQTLGLPSTFWFLPLLHSCFLPTVPFKVHLSPRDCLLPECTQLFTSLCFYSSL